jgi:hypothetical protein
MVVVHVGPRGISSRPSASALEGLAVCLAVVPLACRVRSRDEECRWQVGHVPCHGVARRLVLAQATLDQADARHHPDERGLRECQRGSRLARRLAHSCCGGLRVGQSPAEQRPGRVHETDGPLRPYGPHRRVRGGQRGVGCLDVA